MTTSRLRALLAAVTFLSGATLAQTAAPAKQSNAGDSISQGFDANGWPTDHPELSWVQGTSPDVDSVFSRYLALQPGYIQEPESVSGSELVGGADNFPAQAQRICAQGVKPTRVFVLLGGNDVCNRPRSATSDATANLYSVGTWVSALDAGLDQLAACLPAGAVVEVLSMPRVDYLYQAGHDRGAWCPGVWTVANICRIVTDEGDPARRQQIGARVNAYNDATWTELAAYNWNTNGKNPNGVQFITDWVGSTEDGYGSTSVGTYPFTAADINGTDCFHPATAGQAKFACLAFAVSPDGQGDVAACF